MLTKNKINTPLRFHIQLATWRVFNPYSAVKSITAEYQSICGSKTPTAEYQSIFGSKLQLPNMNPYSAVKSNWRLSDEWQTANNQNHRIIKYKGILISFFLSLVFKTGKLVEGRKIKIRALRRWCFTLSWHIPNSVIPLTVSEFIRGASRRVWNDQKFELTKRF